jgi:hypothetical protein
MDNKRVAARFVARHFPAIANAFIVGVPVRRLVSAPRFLGLLVSEEAVIHKVRKLSA